MVLMWAILPVGGEVYLLLLICHCIDISSIHPPLITVTHFNSSLFITTNIIVHLDHYILINIITHQSKLSIHHCTVYTHPFHNHSPPFLETDSTRVILGVIIDNMKSSMNVWVISGIQLCWHIILEHRQTTPLIC